MILSFYIPTKNVQKFTSFPTFYNIISLFQCQLFRWVKWRYIIVIWFPFPQKLTIWASFYLFTISVTSLKKYLFKYLAHFLLDCFPLLRYKTFQCCKNKSFIMLCNISCQFYLLNRVKGFSFDNIHFIYLFVMNCDFGVVFKKSFPRTTSLKFSLMLYCFFYFCEKCL